MTFVSPNFTLAAFTNMDGYLIELLWRYILTFGSLSFGGTLLCSMARVVVCSVCSYTFPCSLVTLYDKTMNTTMITTGSDTAMEEDEDQWLNIIAVLFYLPCLIFHVFVIGSVWEGRLQNQGTHSHQHDATLEQQETVQQILASLRKIEWSASRRSDESEAEASTATTVGSSAWTTLENTTIACQINQPDDDSCCCPICLDAFRTGQMVSQGNLCPHWFHTDCLELWIVKTVACGGCPSTTLPSPLSPPNALCTCPCCRQDLVQRSSQPPQTQSSSSTLRRSEPSPGVENNGLGRMPWPFPGFSSSL